MNLFKYLGLLGLCGMVLLLTSGQGCLSFDAGPDLGQTAGIDDQQSAGEDSSDDDSSNGDSNDGDSNDGDSDDGDAGDDGSTDDGPEIQVAFTLSAKVVTSIGSGVDGEVVNFTAYKYFWNDFEEEWELRRTMDGVRTTNAAGDPGTTDPWVFGYNLHKGETVFISATVQSSGAKKEAQYSYDQAAAGGGTTASYATQLILDSGI